MKNLFFTLFVAILANLNIYASTVKNKSLNIGVISDLHFLSQQLMDNAGAIRNYVNTSGKNVIDLPEVLDTVVAKFAVSNIQILLIPGDLTKDGEKQSHLDLVKKLAPLRSKGIKIFVIPGNHDINVPNAVKYNADKTIAAKNISSTDFTDIYTDFGYGTAINRDSASLSYVAQLDSDTWLLALDGCLYEQYTDRSLSGGRIKEMTMLWLKDVLEKAKESSKRVVAMMHHGLVEHFPMQSTFFKDYLIEDNKDLAEFLSDNGVKLIFTGHFHANDISEFISSKGNKIYDIETGALCAYPFSYRYIELSRDKIKIRTNKITEIKSNLDIVEQSKSILKEQARLRALSKINSLGVNIPSDLKDKIVNIGANLFLQHLAGDEVLDDDLLNSIKNIAEMVDASYVDTLDDIQIDFYPADNNLEIDLNSN